MSFLLVTMSVQLSPVFTCILIQFVPMPNFYLYHCCFPSQYNANVKVCDAEGRSSLFYARTARDKEVIDLLLQNGCPDTNFVAPPHTPALSHSTLPHSSSSTTQPSTLPRRKGSISRKPDLDKLQASVI